MVCGHTHLDYYITLVNKFAIERTSVEVCALFYYSIKALNFSYFIMNQLFRSIGK